MVAAAAAASAASTAAVAKKHKARPATTKAHESDTDSASDEESDTPSSGDSYSPASKATVSAPNVPALERGSLSGGGGGHGSGRGGLVRAAASFGSASKLTKLVEAGDLEETNDPDRAF